MPRPGLPDNWRIVLENTIGGTLDASKVTVKFRGQYFNSSGKLTYGAESADILAQSGTVADDAFKVGTTQDNGAESNPFLGGDLIIDMDLSTNTATPAGDLIFRLQGATADSPVWPDSGEGQIVAIVNFTSKVDKQVVVSI